MLSYPRIGSRFPKLPTGPCAICGGLKADEVIEIQYDIRGSRETVSVHHKCVAGKLDGEMLDQLVGPLASETSPEKMPVGK